LVEIALTYLVTNTTYGLFFVYLYLSKLIRGSYALLTIRASISIEYYLLILNIEYWTFNININTKYSILKDIKDFGVKVVKISVNNS